VNVAGCHIVNQIELRSGADGTIMFHIECHPKDEAYLADLGFMTYIRNPKFQKYYSDTDEFKNIASQ
jgi:hypothetical protein